MSFLTIKRGTTLNLPCTETSIDLDDVEITAAVRLGGFYEALTVSSIVPGAGTYLLSADTAKWPLGSLECDIKYKAPTYTVRTPTFEIILTGEVTK